MNRVQNNNNLIRMKRIKPRSGVQVMSASIRALFFRELQTRFGQYRLGYLWIFLEPLLTIGVLLVLFGAIMNKILPGIDYVIFLVNGIIPFFLFRTGITQAMSAVRANQGLFSYKPVKPLDAVLARNCMEFLLKFIAYLSFSVALFWLGFEISFSHLPELIMYWIVLFFFMFGMSLIFMVIADFSKEIEKFLTVLFLVLYLLSGVLYSIHIIAPTYRVYLLWNPLIHIFELMRHAISPTYSLVTGINLNYVMCWVLVSLFIGLLLYKRFEKRLVRSK
jgi:capsular polysaccharide transport system permease protein